MYDHPNILVAFLREQPDGLRFNRWPHHITVLPWFKANDEALSSLESITKRHLPLALGIGQTAMFGAREDILVRLVDSDQLEDLHRSLLDEHTGLLGLASSRFVGEHYRPHVTLSGTNDPEPGPLTIGKLSLVKGVGHKPFKRIDRQFSSNNHQ